MMRHLSEKLFGRISIIVLAIVLLLLCFLFYFLAYQVVQADNASKSVTAQLTSQAVVDKIDRNFYERFGDVQAFACNQLARQMLDSGNVTPEGQTFINTMTAYYVLYDLMIICDLNGKVIATNTVDKQGVLIRTDHLLRKNFANEEWFRVCRSEQGPPGGAWYSKFLISPDVAKLYSSQGYGMAFAAPIKDHTGKILGVWYNFASWKEVTQAIRADAEGALRVSDPNAAIILCENTGEIIDAPDDNRILSRLDERAVADPDNFITLNGRRYTFADCITSWATAKGAYTYKGNGWKALTLLTRSTITWSTFISGDLLPVILVTLLLVSVLGLYVYTYFNRAVIGKISGVKHVLESLAQGELPEVPAHLQGKNEIGQMTRSLMHVVDSLKKKASFSDEIAQGHLYTQLQVVSQHDVLGHSLLNMQHKLQQIAEADRQRSWTAEGLAKFNEILRSVTDFEALCNTVLAQIIQHLQASQGALFVTRHNEPEEVWLELAACYAFNRKKYLTGRVLPGEDLVGQAYLEGEVIHLKSVPAHASRITSGLIEAKPSTILIIPLKINHTVEGVLELASFKEYATGEIDFLVKVAEDIASTLASAKINERTRQLLLESQQQAEELKAQEEEMRQNMEEMQATQEEVQRNERTYRLQIQQLQEALDTRPNPAAESNR